jgi:DNA-binding HxlR family transcriptional regulator
LSTHREKRSLKEPCALVIALRKLGGKWSLLVLRELLDHPRRFGELKKPLPWISATSLSRVLAKLEREGFVERKVAATRPVRITYSVVRKDPLLRKVIDDLTLWGRENYPQPERSRSRGLARASFSHRD